jgi:hypothetical protein
MEPGCGFRMLLMVDCSQDSQMKNKTHPGHSSLGVGAACRKSCPVWAVWFYAAVMYRDLSLLDLSMVRFRVPRVFGKSNSLTLWLWAEPKGVRRGEYLQGGRFEP